MAPVQTNLLTLAQLRFMRGAMTERELLNRCKDAARLEMRGRMFSPDDRLDCASKIMLDGLETTNGAPPRGDDPKHSLGSYCKRAQTFRRSIERQRDRDNGATVSEQDAFAWSSDAIIPDIMPEHTTEAQSMHTSIDICRRLKLDPSSSPVVTLFYGFARDLPSAVVALELGLSPNAYDVQCCRARTAIREQYPTAADLLAALVGPTSPACDPMTGEVVLRFVRQDHSKPAHERTHCLAVDPRDGTDAGNWPTRPENAEQADAVCRVSQGIKIKGEKITPQERADSLRRLGYALGSR